MGYMQETKIVLPSPGQLLTPGVTILLSLSVAGFLAVLLAPQAVVPTMGLNPHGVIHGRVWQLVTYPFVDGAALRLVFNGLIVLFIGSSIEREWRTASLLWLWFAVSVSCGVLWVVVNVITGYYVIGLGSTACGYGLIATMGMLFRRRHFLVFFTTVEAQYIAIGLIVIGIILSLPAPITLIWVVGALVAYVYVQMRWGLRTRGSARPALRRTGGGGQFVDID